MQVLMAPAEVFSHGKCGINMDRCGLIVGIIMFDLQLCHCAG